MPATPRKASCRASVGPSRLDPHCRDAELLESLHALLCQGGRSGGGDRDRYLDLVSISDQVEEIGAFHGISAGEDHHAAQSLDLVQQGLSLLEGQLERVPVVDRVGATVLTRQVARDGGLPVHVPGSVVIDVSGEA